VPLIAARGVVAASQPLAAQAGLSMLQRGGNAVDAAIASAVALTVLEPIANGIGGDAFALVWDGNQLHGLNGSGRAPLAHSLDLFASLGLREMPNRGWLPVTVPGALHGRFGKLPFEVLFEPAISYAEEGFPVAPEVAEVWSEVAQIYAAGNPGADVRGWADTFAPDGRVPHAGSVWSLPGHARTLRELAETGVESFYRGKLAVRIAAFAEATGGYLTRADLAAHTSTWVKPIHTSYRGHEIWEIPPNGQGIAALLALDILEGFDLARYPRESADSYHLQIEAMKLAFADAQRYVSDPEHSSIPVSGLLDKSYAAGRRALIGERALLPSAGAPLPGGDGLLVRRGSGRDDGLVHPVEFPRLAARVRLGHRGSRHRHRAPQPRDGFFAGSGASQRGRARKTAAAHHRSSVHDPSGQGGRPVRDHGR
jgi:gamma-glutamyltranspeptidase/glutathione hydrolase